MSPPTQLHVVHTESISILQSQWLDPVLLTPRLEDVQASLSAPYQQGLQLLSTAVNASALTCACVSGGCAHLTSLYLLKSGVLDIVVGPLDECVKEYLPQLAQLNTLRQPKIGWWAEDHIFGQFELLSLSHESFSQNPSHWPKLIAPGGILHIWGIPVKSQVTFGDHFDSLQKGDELRSSSSRALLFFSARTS